MWPTVDGSVVVQRMAVFSFLSVAIIHTLFLVVFYVVEMGRPRNSEKAKQVQRNPTTAPV